MASAWGDSWGDSWGDAWLIVARPAAGGSDNGGSRQRRKRRIIAKPRPRLKPIPPPPEPLEPPEPPEIIAERAARMEAAFRDEFGLDSQPAMVIPPLLDVQPFLPDGQTDQDEEDEIEALLLASA